MLDVEKKANKIMTPREYEAYVEKVVSRLDCWANATIKRNHRFPGVRQPGNYEIDIAFEVRLSGTIFFRFIVECKNWARPVDRPVVQQLAQTRDAIAAHKAAIVSPVGFTKESSSVAKANGVALWVLAENSDEVRVVTDCEKISRRTGGLEHGDYLVLRKRLKELIGFSISDTSVRIVRWTEPRLPARRRQSESKDRIEKLYSGELVDSRSTSGLWNYCEKIWTPLNALNDLRDLVIEEIRVVAETGNEKAFLQPWKETCREFLADKLEPHGVNQAIDAVLRGDLSAFLRTPGQKKTDQSHELLELRKIDLYSLEAPKIGSALFGKQKTEVEQNVDSDA